MIEMKSISYGRSTVTLPWLACVLLLGVAGACDSGPPRLPSFDAVVYGEVHSISNQTVHGARITISGYGQESCPDDQAVARFTELSNREGVYRNELGALTVDTLRCLKVEAEAPSESELDDTTFTVKPVALELREEPPFDSLRVDVMLPPSR